jgi:superfamily II DNA or RNA helicase
VQLIDQRSAGTSRVLGIRHVGEPVATPDQFIVDNSDEHWKALEYVRQWCEISESIDIATGHFELGAFLALQEEWQKVDRIRLLIGGETSRQTADVIAAALDKSIEVERQEGDPLLTGAEGVVQAIRDGKIQIKTYRKRKFHAKAYITHGRLDVVGSAALVGSSNFTRPGLTQNVELNVKFQGPEVKELQDWYDAHWDEAEDVSEELLKVLDHNIREFTPFEVYMKALQSLTQDLEIPDIGWEESESKIYPLLAPYQREGYHALRKMEDEWNGGFLTDGVGLGKTFVGLMLTEYYARRQGKNVLILATKTGQDAVWQPELEARLPELAGGEFTNVIIRAHTDLSLKNADELVKRLKERVDVVIVDEAHNFRNHGVKGDEDEARRSRWWRLQEICEGKKVFLLTATPINNSLFDLVHQAELFTGMDDGYFAKVGVSSLQSYMATLEKPFRDAAKDKKGATTIDLTDFDKLMQEDRLLKSIIHQNSRKYAVESAKVAGDGEVLFPEPQRPAVVSYSLGLHYRSLLDELEAAFNKNNPLFELPMYYPLAFSNDEEIDTVAENRQKQVVGLIRTIFLKRFESSVAAFAGSCTDLSLKILRWLDVNTSGHPDYRKRLEAWRTRHEPLLEELHQRYRPTLEMGDAQVSDDLTEQELEELHYNLTGGDYDLPRMFDAAFEDLTQLGRFLERIADAGDVDDKYQRLRDLLAPTAKKAGSLDKNVFAPAFRTDKVIIFTEFADTARYIHDRLVRDGLADVDRLDGTRTTDRFAMIKRFAPFYNKVSPADRNKQKPLRVLVSTDVLSEGVNLQDGTLLVNYDLHWNPVRLMQRIGRVDRRMDADIEKELVKGDPAAKSGRGKILIRNFLPPDDLETLLRLYSRIQSKVLLISKTLGIPGGKLIKETDQLDDVKVLQEFAEARVGELSPLEELRLKYQDLIAADDGLEERVRRLPEGVSVAKSGSRAGLFACRRLPTLSRNEDGTEGTVWTMEPGRVEWVMLDNEDVVVRSLHTLESAICSDAADQPGNRTEGVVAKLRDLERRETKRYRKEVQLPLDAPTPKTICWIEVQ